MKARGFTLIEVLIAMMIIAIAFTAILKSIGEDIESVTYIETRSKAHWIAVNLINSVNAGTLSPSTSGQTLTGRINAFANTWNWSIALDQTENKNIYTINTHVALQGRTYATLIGSYSLDASRIDNGTY